MMKQITNYEISQSDFSDFSETPSYFNLPWKLTYKGKSEILRCGTSDSISVWSIDGEIYVLSTNFNLDYAAIQHLTFETFDSRDETDSFFVESISNIEQDFFEKSDKEMIVYLLEMMCY